MKFIIFIFTISMIYAGTVYCDIPEKDLIRHEEFMASKNVISKFADSLPKLSPEEMKMGKFTVNSSQKYYEVSYKIKERKIFSTIMNKGGGDRFRSFGDVIPIILEGYSAIYLTIPSGGNQFIVYPSQKDKCFKYSHVGHQNDSELGITAKIIVMSPEKNKVIVMFRNLSAGQCSKFNVSCILPAIITASPITGEVFDINDRYPNYIRPYINECKRVLKPIENAAFRSDAWECKNWMDGFIQSAEDSLTASYAQRQRRTPPPPPPPPR